MSIGTKRCTRLVKEQGIAEQTVLTGLVSDSQLVALYQQASVCVFPLLYEGFDLPVLEAMACGCPVSSNTSSLPEVVGKAGILVNPNNTTELMEVMPQILTDTASAQIFRKTGREQPEKFPGRKRQERLQICMKKLGMADVGLNKLVGLFSFRQTMRCLREV